MTASSRPQGPAAATSSRRGRRARGWILAGAPVLALLALFLASEGAQRGAGRSARPGLEVGGGALARVDFVPAARSGPGGGGARTALEREFELARAMQCLGARDEAALAQEIERFLAGAPETIDALLGRLADIEDPAEAVAIGLMLQAAATFSLEFPEDFAPHSLDSLTETLLAALNSGDRVVTVMRVALGSLGDRLEPRYLGQLLEFNDGGGRTRFDQGSQLEAARLLREWTQGMGPAALGLLEERVQDAEQQAELRGRATMLLLESDPGRYAELALATLGHPVEGVELPEGFAPLADAEGRTPILVALSTAVETAEARAALELVETVARGGLELELSTLVRLDEGRAAELLAVASEERLDATTLDTLELAAAGPGAAAAGLRLLRHAELPERFEPMLCQTMLQGDTGSRMALNEWLGERYARAAPREFWRLLPRDLEGYSRETVEDSIVPWLQLSRGTDAPERQAVADAVAGLLPEYANTF